MDDRIGSQGQARGILQALGGKYEVVEKTIAYTRWAKLPNILKGASFIGLNEEASSRLEAPYPDLILSISRRTTPIARRIKKLSGGKSRIAQLMYPGIGGLQDLDLIIIPEHDRGHKNLKNVFYVTGCPHRVTPEALKEGAEKWAPVFNELPKPLTTLIIGGSIKGKPFSLENARKLGQEVRRLKEKTGGSLLITSSRRTGESAEQAILDELKGIPAYTYLWGEKKENPIMGFWALGEQIIITGDTVSMCSESCGSGKPVLIFCGENWLTPKHKRFVQSLYDGGYAIALDDPDALDFRPSKRLNPSAEAAEQIIRLLD